MAEGRIKNTKENGYGFIRPSAGGRDLFFHASGVQGIAFADLAAGERVLYDVDQSADERGPRAINVQRIDEEETDHAAHA